MSTMSQFFGGGGGVPIGTATTFVPLSPRLTTSGTQTFLASGSITSYDSSYAAAMAENPALRVFGNTSMEIGTTTGSTNPIFPIYYVGTRYVYIPTSGNGAPQYYTTFPTATTAATFVSVGGNTVTVVNNGTYLVYTSSANTAPQVTSNGTAYSAVGGSFATFPEKRAGAVGNNIWVVLSSLDGTTGSQGYIANANPSGTWTVDAGTNVGMTQTNGVAFGNGVFVAVGTSASATAGKIATCTSPAAGWTDRTSASGITFPQAGTSITNVVFTGTHFVATYNFAAGGGVQVIRSSDGINWSFAVFPIAATAGVSPTVSTDGAGKVIITISSATSPLSIFISTDHGATFGGAQLWLGNIPFATSAGADYFFITYANSKFFENHSGTMTSIRDFGSFSTTPDFVGYQVATTNIYYRIK